MRKIIATINLSLDGFCDHTGFEPDEQIHQHYEALLNESGAILYGRITFELMQFWQTLLKEPDEKKSMNDFAVAIDRIPKVVFSNTLKNSNSIAMGWESARFATRSLEVEAAELKKQPGRDILVGSRSLIIQLMNLRMIDEYQLCFHPVVVGGGLPLFDKVNGRTILELLKTKSFKGGAVIHYYKPTPD